MDCVKLLKTTPIEFQHSLVAAFAVVVALDAAAAVPKFAFFVERPLKLWTEPFAVPGLLFYAPENSHARTNREGV